MRFTNAIRSRKLLLGAGLTAFIVGAVIFGIGLYQTIDSGDDSGPEVPVIDVGNLPTPVVTPTPVSATPTPVPTPPLGDAPFTMIIDKLGVNAPVQPYGLDQNAVPEVPVDANAARVVAWYNFSARPGTGSNAVFAGHVTWNGQAVFFNLKSMTPGDEVRLKGEDGTLLVYRVTDVFQVDPNDADSLNVMKATPTDVLTIITCDGAYSDTNDPVFGGEYNRRLVIRASLESVTPRAA